jgi:hypothetical protein
LKATAKEAGEAEKRICSACRTPVVATVEAKKGDYWTCRTAAMQSAEVKNRSCSSRRTTSREDIRHSLREERNMRLGDML